MRRRGIDPVVPPPHTSSDCPIKPFVSQRGSRARDKLEEARAANPLTYAPSNAPTRSDSVSLRNREVDSNGDRGRSAFVVKFGRLAEKWRPGGRLRVTARVNPHQIKPLYASPLSASQDPESFLIYNVLPWSAPFSMLSLLLPSLLSLSQQQQQQ